MNWLTYHGPSAVGLLAQLTPAQQSNVTWSVIWVAVAVGLGLVSYYLVGRLRDRTDAAHPPASELLSNYRELHSQGKLDDQEYRTIKTLLAARLQDELKDTDEKG